MLKLQKKSLLNRDIKLIEKETIKNIFIYYMLLNNILVDNAHLLILASNNASLENNYCNKFK